MRGDKYTQEDEAVLRKMAGAGFFVSDISRALGRTPTAVRQKALEIGVKIRWNKKVTPHIELHRANSEIVALPHD